VNPPQLRILHCSHYWPLRVHPRCHFFDYYCYCYSHSDVFDDVLLSCELSFPRQHSSSLLTSQTPFGLRPPTVKACLSTEYIEQEQTLIWVLSWKALWDGPNKMCSLYCFQYELDMEHSLETLLSFPVKKQKQTSYYFPGDNNILTHKLQSN